MFYVQVRLESLPHDIVQGGLSTATIYGTIQDLIQ